MWFWAHAQKTRATFGYVYIIYNDVKLPKLWATLSGVFFPSDSNCDFNHLNVIYVNQTFNEDGKNLGIKFEIFQYILSICVIETCRTKKDRKLNDYYNTLWNCNYQFSTRIVSYLFKSFSCVFVLFTSIAERSFLWCDQWKIHGIYNQTTISFYQVQVC